MGADDTPSEGVYPPACICENGDVTADPLYHALDCPVRPVRLTTGVMKSRSAERQPESCGAATERKERMDDSTTDPTEQRFLAAHTADLLTEPHLPIGFSVQEVLAARWTYFIEDMHHVPSQPVDPWMGEELGHIPEGTIDPKDRP